MTLPPLPDDLREWPGDPFEVLGIEPGADKKTARRAYATRIRQYKPDHAPEAFQRVREAYETVLQFISWGIYDPAPSTNCDTSPPADDNGDEDSVPNAAGDDQSDPQQPDEVNGESPGTGATGRRVLPPDVEQECRRNWRSALRGRQEEAYAGLQELCGREPQRVEVVTRLYWLLRMFPDLDDERRPIDWLYRGIATCGLTGPPYELLRRELERDPAEAVRPQYERIIDACGPTIELLDVYGWRWQAAGQLQRHSVIVDDVDRLRSDVALVDGQLWGRLLLLALDHLAWTRDTEAKDAFAEFVDEAEHVPLPGTSAHDDLTRLDLLVEAAQGWRRLVDRGNVPKHWTHVIPLTWTLTFDRVRPLLVPVLRDIAREPETALGIFDRLVGESPAAASQLGEAITTWSYQVLYSENNHEEEQRARAMVPEFLGRHVRSRYGAIRLRLLETCLDESMHPQQFASAVAEQGDYFGMDCAPLADSIGNDAALRYVYLAVRTFLG